ncbi:hypothetical protein ACOMHN_008499 [Nucella lapillus]
MLGAQMMTKRGSKVKISTKLLQLSMSSSSNHHNNNNSSSNNNNNNNSNNNTTDNNRLHHSSFINYTMIKTAPESSSAVRLYRFLLEELEKPHGSEGRLLEWVNRNQGLFRILDKQGITLQWGKAKNNATMNYEKFSRSLRYYYKVGVLDRVPGHLVYRFSSKSTYSSSLSTTTSHIATSSLTSSSQNAATFASPERRSNLKCTEQVLTSRGETCTVTSLQGFTAVTSAEKDTRLKPVTRRRKRKLSQRIRLETSSPGRSSCLTSNCPKTSPEKRCILTSPRRNGNNLPLLDRTDVQTSLDCTWKSPSSSGTTSLSPYERRHTMAEKQANTIAQTLSSSKRVCTQTSSSQTTYPSCDVRPQSYDVKTPSFSSLKGLEDPGTYERTVLEKSASASVCRFTDWGSSPIYAPPDYVSPVPNSTSSVPNYVPDSACHVPIYVPNSVCPVPNSVCPVPTYVPNSDCPVPNYVPGSVCHALNSVCPVPNSVCSVPNSVSPMPNSAPNYVFPVPNYVCSVPNFVFPVPNSVCCVPNSVSPMPSSVPNSVFPVPNSVRPPHEPLWTTPSPVSLDSCLAPKHPWLHSSPPAIPTRSSSTSGTAGLGSAARFGLIDWEVEDVGLPLENTVTITEEELELSMQSLL